MIQLNCTGLGKRYNKQWVFRNLGAKFSHNQAWGIIGNNGSGKSTLLKVLAGFERYSEGKLDLEINKANISAESLYQQVAICAPYLSLYDDLSLEEHFDLHCKFKPMRIPDFEGFNALIALQNIKNKALKNYSSGMRQRVKLALAILSETPLLLLDEPTSNLDASSILWYQNLLANHISNRLVFVASNHNQDELFCCKEHINIIDFK